MFVAITNTPRPYAWGSHTAIAELLGRPESGGPEAELWLGAHEGSPSTILDPTQTGGAPDLATWIAEDPDVALGSHAPGGRLPFLLKILAAASPLSLQAHPTAEQARAGFARENAEHIPLGAPHRNYKDAYPKPELIYALSEPFDALCGFRPPETVNAIVGELRSRASTQNDVAAIDDFAQRAGALPELVEWLSSGGPAVEVLVATVTGLAAASDTRFPLEFATVTTLAADYPGDPGVVISLLLNRVALRRGEVLYLPAGNIHAYLFGLGVELMTASDNVLRGGLTPKHIDVPELLSVLDFTPVPVPYLTAERPAPGVSVFRPSVADFVLVHFDGTGSYALDGPAIAICVSGTAQLSGTAQRGGTAQLGGSAAVRTEGGAGGGGGAAAGGAGGGAAGGGGGGGAAAVFGGGEAVGGGGGGAGGGAAGGGGGGGAAAVFGGGESSGTSAVLRRGESVYITPDEGVISVSGGEVFLATTGR